MKTSGDMFDDKTNDHLLITTNGNTQCKRLKDNNVFNNCFVENGTVYSGAEAVCLLEDLINEHKF